jgi:histidyl-tRNA synthetase
MPIQVVIGQKNLKEGNIEIKFRRTDDRKIIKIEEVIKYLKENY